jgi:eukaryotic-like serine/threonine-protein kinase
VNAGVAYDRDRVGPYVLVKAIGAGGSARVDLARIERAYGFQRHVVIKRPLEHLRADARAADSLRREARLGARLRHPNLVAILDAGVYDDYDYLVLEYVHGGALRELMQTEDGGRVRDISLDAALAIVRDVARGIHEAHELRDDSGAPLGLVHRDVSPGNVLLGLDGAVKLADFGIAKETRVATLSGSMHGTVTYMAPEQCRGHAFDRRADIFSLGVILYELATGTRLFWADNDVASLHRVLAGHVPRPRKVRADISAALEDIIMAAVAHDPDKRFATARELADAIERHGAELGHILAARSVSAWVQDILGPRDVPWIGAETVVMQLPEALEPMHEVSLVALIEATPPPDEPLSASFGPSDVAAADELAFDTQPSLAPVRVRRRHRALWAAVIGIGLATGVALAYLATREGDELRAGDPAANELPATTPSASGEAPAIEEADPAAGPATPDVEDDAIEIEHRPTPQRSRKRPKQAAKPPAVEAGSGSGSARANPKVQWDPTMLLPTDKKK